MSDRALELLLRLMNAYVDHSSQGHITTARCKLEWLKVLRYHWKRIPDRI